MDLHRSRNWPWLHNVSTSGSLAKGEDYHLSGQQLGALTAQQIATGLDSRKIGLLSAEQVKGFNKTQIQALTQPQVAALSVADLTALTNTQLTSFKVDQLGSFTKAQITWVYDNKLDAGFAKGQLNKIAERYASIPLPWTRLVGSTAHEFGQSVATAADGSGQLRLKRQTGLERATPTFAGLGSTN